MAKSAENMTHEERLKRIRSLERRLLEMDTQNMWARQDREHAIEWGEKAHVENRRLCDIIDRLVEKVGPLPIDTMGDIRRREALREDLCGEFTSGFGGLPLVCTKPKGHPESTHQGDDGAAWTYTGATNV